MTLYGVLSEFQSTGLLAVTCGEKLMWFAAYAAPLPRCNHLLQYDPHITVLIIAFLLSLSRGK